MKHAHIEAFTPHLRPHIVRRDLALFFMISRRPLRQLSPEELTLYELIDGHRSVSDLERLQSNARAHLLTWHRCEIIELVPPTNYDSRPHLVVIEPHMDDAALSVGGRLQKHRDTFRITILSVMKWSHFTSYLTRGAEYINVRDVTELRIQESVLAAKICGADYSTLDWFEAPLRCWPTERWSPLVAEQYSRLGYQFTVFIPEPKEVSLLAEHLSCCLAELAPDELWIPLGTSNHWDHRTTRNACLRLLAERDRFANVSVSLYEDLPYAEVAGHAEQICGALTGAGTRLTRHSEDITDQFEEKMRVISVYASQFKRSFIEPRIRRIAEREGGGQGKLAETYYRLEGQVFLPPETLLERESEGILALETAVRSLRRQLLNCTSFRIVVLPSGSLMRGRVDCLSLTSAFPNAKFRVYAPETLAWQTEGGDPEESGRLIIEHVKGAWQWVWLVVKEMFRIGTPTVVLWRGAYGAPPHRTAKRLVNLCIKALLPLRTVLLARTLRDITLLMEGDLSRGYKHGGLLSDDG